VPPPPASNVTTKRALQLGAGLLMSGLMLYAALRAVDMQEAAQAMQEVAWWVYPAYFAQLCVTHLLRTWRWRMQVERLTSQHLPFKEAFGICCISFAGTFLLPFRFGELIRPYMATQRGYGRKSAGLATVALERVLDGLVMTGVLAVMISQVKNVDPKIRVGGYLALVVFGGALAVFIAAYRWRELSLRFWGAVLNPISRKLAEKLLGMMGAFLDGLKSLPTLKDIAVYVAITVAYWLINGFGMWMLAEGMGLNVPVLGAYFVLACLVVGITIPAGPGNVGNFEYAIQISLTAFGVSQADGAAYGIWTHLFQLFHMLVMCLPFLGMLHLSKMTEDGDVDPAQG
jgi:uncharacterized protein (TIRG00374 family)